MEREIDMKDFISDFSACFETERHRLPWELTTNLKEIIEGILRNLSSDFKISDGVAIHKSAVMEDGVTIKRPFIAMENCHIGANTNFREGVFLDKSVKIGPSSEIKSSIICSGTAIAHLNYVGK